MNRTARLAVLAVLGVLALSSVPSALAVAPPTDYPTGLGSAALPATVGPMGPVGAALPLTAYGPPVASPTGPRVHVGPVNVTTPTGIVRNVTTATLSVLVMNGTALGGATHAGAGQVVVLTNLTFSTVKTKTTNAAGFANFTTTKGSFMLNTRPSDGTSTRMNTTQLVWVKSTSVSLTLYQVPRTLITPSVNNGGATKSYVLGTFDNTTFNFLRKAEWPIVAQLWNFTASPHTLAAQSVLADNGSATFTAANRAFTYAVQIVAANDNYTSESFGFNTRIGGSFTCSTTICTKAHNSGFEEFATDTTTGTVTGTPLPTVAAPSKWTLAVDTAITGGTTWLGTGITASASTVKLLLVNAVVFVNWTYPGPNYNLPVTWPTVRCFNSTLVLLAPLGGGALHDCSHSVVVGASYRPQVSTVEYLAPTYLNASFLAYEDGRHGSTTGSWADDYVWNLSGSASGLVYPIPPTVTHSAFSNGTLDFDESSMNVSYTYFDNSTITLGLSSGGGNDALNHLNLYANRFTPHLSTVSRGSNFVYGAVSSNLFSASSSWNVTPTSSVKAVQFPSKANVSLDVFTVPNRNVAVSEPIVYCECAGGNVSNNWVVGVLNPLANATVGIQATGAGSKQDHNTVDAGTMSFDGAGWEIGYNYLTDLVEMTTVVGAWPTPNGATSGTFDNNTFGYLLWNSTFYTHLSSGSQGGSTDFATVRWSQFANVDHNDFKNALGGGTGTGGPATDIIGPQMNVTNCAFENTLGIHVGTGSGFNTSTTNTFDVGNYLQASGGSQTSTFLIHGNVFVNLSTNAPFFVSNAASGHPHMDLATNLYYWSAQTTGLTSAYTTVLSNGTVTGFAADSTYVYNSSGGSAPWTYRIVPDVRLVSGVYRLGYSNGLVAGTVPAFKIGTHTWKVAVELDHVRVTADATTAGPITVVLSGLTPAGTYELRASNTSGTVPFYDNTSVADGSGSVSFVYAPATMPLNSTVWVTAVGTGGFVLTTDETLLLGAAVIVAVIGITWAVVAWRR